MKKKLIIAFLILSTQIYSQNSGNIWYFGENAGLNFSTNPPTVLTDGLTFCREGVATVSDSSGLLVFYTDGVTVWNKNHAVMNNGNNLQGHTSSTHSATVVKQPGTNSNYYIFTTPDKDVSSTGFRYTVVDMSLNNGLGGVVTGAKNILIDNNTSEKVCILQIHKDTAWIIHHQWNNNTFNAYPLTSQGLQSPVTSNVGGVVGSNIANSVGYMKSSVKGNKIAMCVMDYTYDSPANKRVEVFDFNVHTGQISNPLVLQAPTVSSDGAGYYGVEFSPSGTLLYVSHIIPGAVYQYNLALSTPSEINNSRIELSSPQNTYFGSLQLAKNGKIYIAKEYSTFLDVIDNPDILGTACGYVSNGQSLGTKKSRLGLPVIPYFRNTQIVSIEEQAENNQEISFLVFPNPASGELNIKPSIEFQSNILSLQIIDMAGRIISDENIQNYTGSVISLGISQLPSSSYILKISVDRTNSRFYKFIKQ